MRNLVIVGLLMILGGCSFLNKQDLGMSTISPDETVVEQRKPLSLPPEFDIRPSVAAHQVEE